MSQFAIGFYSCEITGEQHMSVVALQRYFKSFSPPEHVKSFEGGRWEQLIFLTALQHNPMHCSNEWDVLPDKYIQDWSLRTQS